MINNFKLKQELVNPRRYKGRRDIRSEKEGECAFVLVQKKKGVL